MPKNRQEQTILFRFDRRRQCQCVLCKVKIYIEQETTGKLKMKQRIGYRVAWLCKVNNEEDAVLQYVLVNVPKLAHLHDFA